MVPRLFRTPQRSQPPSLEIVRLPEYEDQLVTIFTRRDERTRFDQAVDATLAKNPDAGEVIQQTGGFRKLRVARTDRVGGKSGGARVIYLHVPAIRHAFLFTVYAKGELDTISADGKKVLRSSAGTLKAYRPSPTRIVHRPRA
ncbi:MAG: toxin [Solirubrobacteraceae bacterium]